MNDSRRILELAIKAGEILLYNGGEIFRVQETMLRIAKAYGAEDFHVYIVSTGIFATALVDGRLHSTTLVQIPLSAMHLGRVIAVNSLSRDIACGRCEIDEAFRRLETIEAIPFYPPWMRVLVTGLGCAGFGFILGGDFFDSMISFLSGAILSCFLIYADRRKLSKIIANLMASALVTLCGLTFFHLGLGNHIDKIIIGSLMPLVPGVALTTSIRDFLNTDYLSGMIRLIDTLLVASCIAIGVGAVLGAASLFLGVVV